jgi:hypothetical protein
VVGERAIGIQLNIHFFQSVDSLEMNYQLRSITDKNVLQCPQILFTASQSPTYCVNYPDKNAIWLRQFKANSGYCCI